MLRKFFYLFIILGLVFTSGCGSNNPDSINSPTGQRVDLKTGQTVSITGEDLAIKFLEVVNDSRCPSNVVCVWVGEVTVITEIAYRGSVYQKTLVKSGASGEYVSTDFQEYEIQFDVQPYPEAGKTVREEDYYLKLIVNRTGKTG